MRISPIITNSGTATRMELEFTFQAICPSMSHSGRSEKRYIRAMPISPRAPATCSPARKNTSMSTAAVPSTMAQTASCAAGGSAARSSAGPAAGSLRPAKVATAETSAASASRLNPTPRMPWGM